MILHRAVLFTIYIIPFLLAALIGALAACIVIIALWKAGVRPRATERSLV